MPINYKLYPPYWHKLSKHIRFVRANNRCEWCGAANHQPHPITGSRVVLTVAHLNHDINDNRFSNLAALCQRCHNQYDAPKRARSRRRNRDNRNGQSNMFDKDAS